MPKLITLVMIILIGLSNGQPGTSPSVSRQPDELRQEQPYEEHNFYYNGEKWTPSWFQCDGANEVSVFEKSSDSETQVLLKFQKTQPVRQRKVQMVRDGEPDCGMMKCRWSFKAVAADRARL